MSTVVLLAATILANLLEGETDIVQRHHASVSPDGARIVYHAHRPNGYVGLYVSAADGSDERPLYTPDSSHAQEPRWSPDGEWIAFVGGENRNPGSFALQIIRPDGGGHEIVARSPDAQIKSPSWSPDGRALAFEVRRREERSANVHVIRPDGTGERDVTHEIEGMNQMPRWAPNGQGILVSWRDKDYTTGDLYLLPVSGSNFEPGPIRWLTRDDTIENMPAWTPDGAAIFFVAPASAGARYDLFRFDLESEEVLRVTSTPGTDEFFPAVSPDGEWIFVDAFTDADGVNRSSIVRYPRATLQSSMSK